MKVIPRFLLGLILVVLTACNSSVQKGQNSLDKVIITKLSGDQFVLSGQAALEPLAIKVSNVGRDPSDLTVRYEILSGSVPATLSQTSVSTDKNGIAQINLQAGITSGVVKVRATLPQANLSSASVEFTINIQGNAVAWRISPSGSLTAGNAVNVSIEAIGLDNSVDTDINGPRYLSFSTTASASPSGTPPVLPPNGIYTLVNGVVSPAPQATFYNSSDSGVESFKMTVSGGGLIGTSASFLVSDGSQGGVSILASDSCAGATVGNRFASPYHAVIVYGYKVDSFGNCIGPAIGDWTKTFSDAEVVFNTSSTSAHSISFTPNVGGATGHLTFTEGSFSDDTGTIQATDADAHHYAILGLDAEGNFTTTAGEVKSVLVRVEDIMNNVVYSYDGHHNLKWSTTATSSPAIPELGISASAPVLPPAGSYLIIDGVVTSPLLNARFYNSSETPTMTVYEGASCAGNICGVSSPITVNDNSLTHALIRTAANNAGSIFKGPLVTTTADSSYNFYCATYDAYGNFLVDNPGADWSFNGAIQSSDISPGLTDRSTITYNARVAGTGRIFCDVDGVNDGSGIADETELITVLPGTPKSFAIDAGTGNGNAFSVTAGSVFSLLVKVYDNDGNYCSNYNNASHSVTASYQGSTAINPAYPSEIAPTYTTPKIDNSNVTAKSLGLNFSGGVATLSNLLLINDTENADEPFIRIVDNAAVVTTANSGLISVNQGSLANISIMSSANGSGTSLNAVSLSTDGILNMFAAGFDNSGNYIGDQNVNWLATPPSGTCTSADLSGNPIPLTSTVSAIFNPNVEGTCTISAYHAGINKTDTTGVMNISYGTAVKFSVALQGNITNVTAGAPFNIVISALDSGNNIVEDYVPDFLFSLTTTAPNSTSGQAPTGFTLAPGNFVNGVATVTGAKVFKAGTPFTITVTETGAGSKTGTSASFTVSPNTLHHYATTNMTGPFVADGSSPFSVSVEARDQWENLTTTGITTAFNLSAVRTSDEATVTSITGGTSISLGGISTKVVSGLTYLVSHGIEVVAQDANGITTPSGLRASAVFTPHIAGLKSYALNTFSTVTPTAGSTFTARVYALDIAGNTITGLDGTLGTLMITASGSAANPPYLNATPSYPSGLLTFTAGVSAPVSYTLYAKETLNRTSFVVTDANGITGNGGAGTIAVSGAALNHYSNTTSTPVVDADGVAPFNATIRAHDTYGNIVPGDSALTLVPAQTDGKTAGLLAGTTTGANLSTGILTISNLKYNIPGTMEIRVSGGTVSMDSARSVDYTMTPVIGSLHHYDLSFTGPATAGVAFTVTVLAKDYGDNPVPSIQGDLNTRNFRWTEGLNNSPEADLTSPNSGSYFSLTFNSSGSASTNITFVKAETLAISGLDIADNAATNILGTSESALTINPNVAHHIVMSGAATGTADNLTSYSLTVQSRDDWGNPVKTNNALDSALTVIPNRVSGYTNTATLGGTTAVNLKDNATVVLSTLKYQVAHTTRFGFSGSPSVPLDNALSTNTVVWSMDKKTVASYTLEASPSTATAGVNQTFLLSAFDGGGNLINAHDSVLNTISYTFTTSADCNAPAPADSPTTYLASNYDPANGTKTFTGGVTTLTYKLFMAQATCGNAGDISVTDENTRTKANAINVVVSPNVSNYFATTSSGFPAVANNSAQTATNVTVQLRDFYGNPRTDSSVTAATLTFAKNTGYGTTLGTLEACSPQNGDTCGSSKQSLASMTLDFTSSNTLTINDFNYNVGHTIAISAASGGLSTPAVYKATQRFTPTYATIADIKFERPGATGVAGAAQIWKVSAYDAALNKMDGTENETLLETIKFTVTDMSGSSKMNGPESGTVGLTSNIALNFNAVTGYGDASLTFYHAINNVDAGWLRLTNDKTVHVIFNSSTDVMDITSAVANHFHVTTAGFDGTEVSDGQAKTATSATITLQDLYGNLTTGPSAVALAPIYVSGHGSNMGVMQASLTDGGARSNITALPLNFSATSSVTIYDLSYNVFQVVDIRATSGAVTTVQANSQDMTWNFNNNNLASYRIFKSVSSGIAGTPVTMEIRAYDQAGNVMTGALNKAFLDTRTLTISDLTAGSMNGPESGTVVLPAPALYVWNSATGNTNFSMTTFNKANGIGLNYLKVTDDGATPITGQNTTDSMLIVGAAGNHFHVTAGGFPILAEGAVQTASSLTIQLQDVYGNATIDSSVTSVSLSLRQIAGYSNLGNFNVRTSDGVGSPVAITGLTPSFNVSPTVTYYDSSYDVAQTFEIVATKGSITTAANDSADLVATFTAKTVKNYVLAFDAPTTVAGTGITATLTAYDGGANVITSNDSVLNTISFTHAVANGSFNAPNASQTVSANLPATGTKVWSSGTTSITYKFFATGTVPASYVSVTDTTNTLTRSNTNTTSITPAAGASIQIPNPLDGIIDTFVSVTMNIRDAFGNIDTNFQDDITLGLSGSATGGGTIDIVNGTAIQPVSDSVREQVFLTATYPGLINGTEDIYFTGPIANIVYITNPVANQTVSKTFGVQPTVELRDSTGTRVYADSASVITLSPYTDGACTSAAAGTLASNTVTANRGRNSFSALNYNTAGSIYIKASSGGVEVCSPATTVYPTLAIDNMTGGSVAAGVFYPTNSQQYEISGGVPPLSIATSTSLSGGSFSALFTGGSCPAGKNCVTYTAGSTVGTLDTLIVRDSAAVVNQVTDQTTVNGVLLVNTGASTSLGSTITDISRTYTIKNNGNIPSGALSVSFAPDNATYWTKTSDACNGVSLAAAGSCNIIITFKGSSGNGGNPTNGNFTAVLSATGATNGSINLNLTAAQDGPILNVLSGSGTFGTVGIDSSRTITIRNDGNANSGTINSTLILGTAAYWGITGTCENTDLAPGNTCTVIVTFKAGSGYPPNGAYTGTIRVRGAASDDETIALSATRSGAILTKSSGNETYGISSVDITRTFIIQNTGNASTGAITVNYVPDSASAWTITFNDCTGNDLAVNATCSIDVTFRAGNAAATIGAHSASLSLQGATAGTRTLNLTGTKN